jgi:hypothetical protein
MAENCPHCKAEIDCDAMWRNTDHNSEFSCVCGECDGIISVSVSMCPEFSVDVPRCPLCDIQIDGTRPYCAECADELKRLK